MAEPYFDEQETPAASLGQRVYHDALEDRRGFRVDQVGIPIDDDVWSEIFEAIGRAVLDDGYVPASEVQRAREEALEQAAALIERDEYDGSVRMIPGEGLRQWLRRQQAAAIRALATPLAENGSPK